MATADLTPCDYCGLPVRGSTASEPLFCCYGCRIAAAITKERGDEGQTRWQLTRLGVAIFFTMNVMVFTLALWSREVYDDEVLRSHQASVLFDLLRYASLLLASIVTVLLGVPLLENAVDNLRRREITTDLLIVAGVIAAMFYSLIAVATGGPHTYFEVACMVLVGVTLGRWLEAVGKLKTTNAIRSLEKLLPQTVRVVGRSAGVGVPEFLADPASSDTGLGMWPLDDVEIGHLIRVLPGERIPTDGKICLGRAAIDEKIVTGESLPSIKETGDEVFAGTLNHDGDLLIKVTAPPRGGALLRIIDAVTEAATAKSRLQSTADRVTGWFVPAVIVVAMVTLGIHTATSGVAQGVMAALAVLLIACPCALGIATPLAVWAAMGRASAAGILFRHGDALQQLAGAKAICFDKTGTLTTGETVVDELIVDRDQPADEALQTARALAASSTHIFSSAILKYALDELNVTPSPCPADLETRPGQGVIATLEHPTGKIYLGSLALMEEAGLQRSASMRETIATICRSGKPLACIGWDGNVRGVFTFREHFREEARRTLDTLQANGYPTTVLTGDYASRTSSLECLLGVSVRAELMPDQKLAAIRELRRQHGPVIMVGDGINDAPALAEADVGIAMACGADISRETADICLLGDNLEQIGWSINLAKRTMRIVRQNLFWAFSYNAIGIVLAATGLLNPIWAAVAMVGSSLFVVSNSLRLANLDGLEQERPSLTQIPKTFDSTSPCSVVPTSS